MLHPGCVTLDGPSALAFARSRHLEYMLDGVYRTDPTGDLGRITRQQLLIRNAISRAVSKGLTNPLTLKRLVDVGVSNIGIDDELSAVELLQLGRRFAKFDSKELVTYTLPVTDFVTDGGAKVLAARRGGRRTGARPLPAGRVRAGAGRRRPARARATSRCGC